jgi:hypothetical protein
LSFKRLEELGLEYKYAACELGIIKEGGAGWKELPNGKKIQGWENMYDFLSQEENKEVLNEIEKSYRELIQ